MRSSAALLALLNERPALAGERAGKTSWSTIASHVVLRGSALTVWHDLHPPTLDGTADPALQLASQQLVTWTDPGCDFDLMTVLDAQYPQWLRMIHQMPPLLFVKGGLRAKEIGVSVVGSRDATERGCSIAANIAEGLAQRATNGASAAPTPILHRRMLSHDGFQRCKAGSLARR
ncbi:MAG: hypothetical protein CK429_35495 [Mycobacterium sp.]|uniref:DNA-processing protein DprA n=1 Tax=Mycobacterium sp. MS3 TaxID=3391378 RepID=UPI000CC170B2|nr:MAG: hypothetical protein CK429_35495 [Mycobacterium sp.]